jgi:hypothetical protein
MTIYSPMDDFMQRTLSKVQGAWAQLEYVASLREEENEQYQHWGMTRVFGVEPAQHAIAHVHRDLVLQLLRTPLSALVDDARCSAEQQGMPLNLYVQQLSSHGGRLLPVKLGGGSVRHFNSVLLALSALAACPQTGRAATLQVS